MKIGILITARLGSKRLSDKHLKPVLNQPIITFLINRIRHEFKHEIDAQCAEIIISSTPEERNKALIELSNGQNVSFFAGSIENIPLRHLENAKEHNCDALISIDGDDILCSPEAMRNTYTALKEGHSFVKVNGLPLGMNCSGYSAKLLEDQLSKFQDSQLETGWGRLFENIEAEEISMGDHDIYNSEKRFTLDYDEDFQFFKAIIEHFGKNIKAVSTDDIVDFCDNNSIYKINSGRAKEYWENFYKELESQKG